MIVLVGLLVGAASLSSGHRPPPTSRETLAEVPGLSGVAAIDAAGNHSVALTADGRVLAWGSTEAGVGGPGPEQDCSDRTPSSTYYPCRPTPTAVPLPGPATAVASSSDRQFALLEDGSVWTWGADHGRRAQAPPESCGASGVPYPCHRTPERVAGLPPVVALAAGLDHALALDRGGRVWQWGAAAPPLGTAMCSNEVGRRRYLCAPDPVLVPGLPSVTAVVAHGSTHSLAIDTDGGVWRWSGVATPSRVPLPVAIADVGVGSEGSQAVLVGRDGSVWVTGRVDGLAANECGRQCTVRPVQDLPVGSAVATMSLGGLRVRARDGQVLVRRPGGASPPTAGPLTAWVPETDLAGATAIATGEQHTLVLLADGRVLGKGYNADGELGL